jgi:hypothetical protein
MPAKTSDVCRIDGHIHGNPADLKGSPAAYLRKLRAMGISAAVLVEEGALALAAARKLKGFIIPVAQIKMDECDPEEVGRWLDAGCRGIKFIAPHFPYSDGRYWPMYEAIEKHGAVAVFHTGYYRLRGREERPVNMQFMCAAEIDVIARRFTDLKVIMAHFSNPWWEEAWKVSWSNPNVYADLSGGTAFQRSLGMWAEIFAPNGRLMENSLCKLTFATDKAYFKGEEAHRVPPYIDFYQALFDRVGAPEKLRRAIWGETLLRLFGAKL